MKDWFESLLPRERVIVTAGGSFVILMLIWTLAWTPLANRVQELEILISEKNSLLVNLAR
ncbi:MAG: type II secretion system protein GspM, partial [Candidatus Rariloculaceae bacterium]